MHGPMNIKSMGFLSVLLGYRVYTPYLVTVLFSVIP